MGSQGLGRLVSELQKPKLTIYHLPEGVISLTTLIYKIPGIMVVYISRHTKLCSYMSEQSLCTEYKSCSSFLGLSPLSVSRSRVVFHFSRRPQRLPMAGKFSDFHMEWTDVRNTSSASIIDFWEAFPPGSIRRPCDLVCDGNIHSQCLFILMASFPLLSLNGVVAKDRSMNVCLWYSRY